MRPVHEIMDLLDPLFDDFDAIVRAGMATYMRYEPALRLEHDSRAAAACIYSHMLAEADRRWSGRAGIIAKDIRGLKVWIVGDHAVMRLKRMDEDGRSRNYPTKQAKQYDAQKAFAQLPDAAERLTLGYLADPTQTAVERVQVARPIGRAVDFCAAIIPPAECVSGQRRWQDVTRQASFG